MGELADKVALVTGSTSGIGLAIAKALAGAGASVVINGLLGQADGDILASGIEREHGGRAVFHPAQVSNAAEVAAMTALANKRFGAIDILINNAGIQHVAPVEEFPEEAWNRIIAVNLTGCFWTTQQVLPDMRARKWGRIINIASVHGLIASPNKAAYVSAKHGVIGLTKTVALETAGSGITCNAVCPAWVRTPLAEKQVEQFADDHGIDLDEAATRLISERQPSGRFIERSEIARMVLFLCGPGSEQISGASLPIDGAWLAQ